MAAVYSNSLNLFNLTTKATPVSGDFLALGDSAVTGVPLKQCTVGSLPFAPIGGSTVVNVTTATQAMAIDSKYFVNYTGGACTLTLPTAGTSVQGAYVEIIGGEANTAGFIIALNAGQSIRLFGNTTTVTTGTVTVPGAFDSLVINCDATASGLTWTITKVNASGSVLIQ